MNKNQQTDKRRYGLLSMLALIVGVVIGAGIFAKNQQIFNTGAVPFESMMSWIIVSVIVIFILISFLEISSITMKKKEAGTIANWSRHLWGEKMSIFVGVFFPVVYFPILLAGLSVFASNNMLTGIQESLGGTPIDIGTGDIWSNFTLITLLGIATIIIIGAMNAISNKPGKVFQTIGTFIKLIPLFLIILIGIIMISGGIQVEGGLSFWEIFNPNSDINIPDPSREANNMAIMILMILPAVMFSFDGFLNAASLSNEAKSPTTFKVAAVSGITFITIIYLCVTLFTYMVGGNESSVNDAISKAFGGAAWVSPLIIFVIFISMVTGISGNVIFSNRVMADLSVEKIVVDKNGLLTRRTENGSLYISGSIMLALALGWFIIMRTFDGLDIMQQLIFNPGAEIVRLFAISAWLTDLIIIISYSIYTVLMIGGIRNRFTDSVEVDKNKMFIPSSLIAIPSVTIITGYFAYDTLNFYAHIIDENFKGTMMQVVGMVAILMLVILIPIILVKVFKKQRQEASFTNRQIWYKKVYDYSYRNLLTINETFEKFENTIPDLNNKKYSFASVKKDLSNSDNLFNKQNKNQ